VTKELLVDAIRNRWNLQEKALKAKIEQRRTAFDRYAMPGSIVNLESGRPRWA